ncbi:MAG TPA: PIN domain-containing protein, partial [Polyangiaceae bacterium]|nr:PIN domain-containing protein [Polyangiaceae bacterium]
MKKNYVLDTNVLLYDPRAIFKFEDNDVIIPIYVIEEIDTFKRETTERGRNARMISRLLDEQRGADRSLAKGVQLDAGGALRIWIHEKRPTLGVGLDKHSQDQAILQTAIDVRDKDTSKPTVFVTMDTNLRIRADAVGITSETYENQRVEDESLEQPFYDLEMDGAGIDAFFQDGHVPAPAAPSFFPNAAVMLRDATSPGHTALGRFDAARGQIVSLRVSREGVLGVRPRNREQTFALDVLLDDSIRLVTLLGKAGTGKTLMAIAAGLKRTTEDGTFTRLVVSRPIMPLGRDIGFLPGDVDEKLNPWMQPIFDNLEFLFSNGGAKSGRGSKGFLELLETGTIQVEPLTYIRGRSL